MPAPSDQEGFLVLVMERVDLEYPVLQVLKVRKGILGHKDRKALKVVQVLKDLQELRALLVNRVLLVRKVLVVHRGRKAQWVLPVQSASTGVATGLQEQRM